MIDGECASVDFDIALGIDAFGSVGCDGEVDIATLDVDVAAVLVVVVCGFASRGIASKVALDAVVAYAADVYRTALNQEVFLAVDTVTYG